MFIVTFFFFVHLNIHIETSSNQYAVDWDRSSLLCCISFWNPYRGQDVYGLHLMEGPCTGWLEVRGALSPPQWTKVILAASGEAGIVSSKYEAKVKGKIVWGTRWRIEKPLKRGNTLSVCFQMYPFPHSSLAQRHGDDSYQWGTKLKKWKKEKGKLEKWVNTEFGKEGHSRVEKPLWEAHLLLVQSDSRPEKLSRTARWDSSVCLSTHSFILFNNDLLPLITPVQEAATSALKGSWE